MGKIDNVDITVRSDFPLMFFERDRNGASSRPGSTVVGISNSSKVVLERDRVDDLIILRG